MPYNDFVNINVNSGSLIFYLFRIRMISVPLMFIGLIAMSFSRV